MSNWHRFAIFYSALCFLAISPVQAAPSSSCASKYVGTWNWTWTSGQTEIRSDGTAYPKCAIGCVPKQYWSCNGNSFTFSNEGGSSPYNMTLSADGTKLEGSWGVAERVGGAAQVVAVPPVARQAKSCELTPAKYYEHRRRADRSVEDIPCIRGASNCNYEVIFYVRRSGINGPIAVHVSPYKSGNFCADNGDQTIEYLKWVKAQ